MARHGTGHGTGLDTGQSTDLGTGLDTGLGTGPGTGTWVYAVAAAIPGDLLAGMAGVGGENVRAVRAGGLAAAVGTVNLAEFGEQPLREHLEDLQWLDATARVHHRVVEVLAGHGPVVPMRLAVVFRDDGGAERMLVERRNDLAAALERVAGRVEWGVKVYALPERSAEPAPTAAGDTQRPGLAYLNRRRAEIAKRAADEQAGMVAARQVHDELQRLAVAAQRHAPQHPHLAGRGGHNVLNGAYLVDARRAAEFSTAAERLGARYPDVRIELTGPWPPYSFAAAPDATSTTGTSDGTG